MTSTKLKQLNAKLDAAINSRAMLEEEFNKRSAMLNEFIVKLSSVCKGLDLELDNRLAKLRSLLKKSVTVEQIEKEIDHISGLLMKQSSDNEKHIRTMHLKFHQAGSTLQKAKGIPALSRRNLRELLSENEDTKDALTQYVPKLSELLTIYAEVLAAKNDIEAGKPSVSDNNKNIESLDISDFIKRISTIINSFKLSKSRQEKLNKIKVTVIKSTKLNESLLNSITEIFDIVASDMEKERRTTKSFLSTLSGALTKLQRTLKSSITNTNVQKERHTKINNNITEKLGEMIDIVDAANSLSEVKVELNEKINVISKVMNVKSIEELEYYQNLEQQLALTQTKVQELEKQGQNFEKRLIEQQKKSMQDGLTKLHNRASFDDHIAKAMVRFHHQPFELSLAIIDLDNFKSINDTYGHTAGDKTLQVIAQTLTRVLGDSAFIARYGGEEFILIFEELDYGTLMLALDNLRSKISKLPFKFKNSKVNITTSIGATHIIQDDNVHQAFERADQALYKAKNSGKNQVLYAE